MPYYVTAQAHMENSPTLDIVNLECARGHRKLFTKLNCAVKSGTMLHVQGANGSGKTTLLRAICGLLQPQDGTIHWGGINIQAIGDDFNHAMLYLGHLDGIKLDLTSIENLRIAVNLGGYQLEDRILWDVLAKIGLAGVEDLPCRVLSQGQRRRVALAKLFTNRAKLWILDEPFVGLDKSAVALVLRLITDHLAGDGLVVLTTHQEVDLPVSRLRTLKLGLVPTYV